jgi:hypothetical protein
MKLEEQSRVREKPAGGARRHTARLAIVLLGIGACVFSGRIDFVQELLFFVGVTALLVFIGTNLWCWDFCLKRPDEAFLGFSEPQNQ